MRSLVPKVILPVLFFAGFSGLYVWHLSRSVYGGDVGDLVTAAALGGVPHPSGYPLFTFLGFLLSHTPLALISQAFAIGMISALSGALGIVIFYLLTKRLTQNTLCSVIASLVLGFSFLYWFYAEVAEVFALNAFFAIALFYVALLFREERKALYAYIFFFILGLSCTHHSTIILIFPSLFLLIGKEFFSTIKAFRLFLLGVIISFSLGLTPFLYIFIASAHNPIVNWDNVHDIPSFFHLILRKDYGTFQAGLFDSPSLSQRLVTLWTYMQNLVIQLTIPVVVLVMSGFFTLWKKSKIIFISLLLAWILTGPGFLVYAGFPLTSSFIIGAYERFTLLSSVIFLIPFGMGLATFTTFLARFLPKRHYATVFQVLFLFIPLMLCIYNFPKTNLASVSIGDTYALDFLHPLPPNAIFLVAGDTQIFNTWYMHFVRGVRPDVLVYNIGAAEVTHNSIANALTNIPESKKTEALIPLLRVMRESRPVFSNNQFQPKSGAKLIWVPYGLTYEMFESTDMLPDKTAYEKQVDTIWAELHVPTRKDKDNLANHSLTINEIPDDYSNALIAAGTFIYTHYQDTNKTYQLYTKARDIAPDNEKAYSALGVLSMGMAGKCQDAATDLTTSLAIDAYQETPYFLLYNIYMNCFKDKQKAQDIAQTYSAIFQKDFQKEMQKSKNITQLQ